MNSDAMMVESPMAAGGGWNVEASSPMDVVTPTTDGTKPAAGGAAMKGLNPTARPFEVSEPAPVDLLRMQAQGPYGAVPFMVPHPGMGAPVPGVMPGGPVSMPPFMTAADMNDMMKGYFVPANGHDAQRFRGGSNWVVGKGAPKGMTLADDLTLDDMEQMRRLKEIHYRARMLPPPLTFEDHNRIWYKNNHQDDQDDDDDVALPQPASKGELEEPSDDDNISFSSERSFRREDRLEAYRTVMGRWYLHALILFAKMPQAKDRATRRPCPSLEETRKRVKRDGVVDEEEVLRRWSGDCAGWWEDNFTKRPRKSRKAAAEQQQQQLQQQQQQQDGRGLPSPPQQQQQAPGWVVGHDDGARHQDPAAGPYSIISSFFPRANGASATQEEDDLTLDFATELLKTIEEEN